MSPFADATRRDLVSDRTDTFGLALYDGRYDDPLIGRFSQPGTMVPGAVTDPQNQQMLTCVERSDPPQRPTSNEPAAAAATAYETFALEVGRGSCNAGGS